MPLNRIETEEFVFELSDDQYTRAVDFMGCMAQPVMKNAESNYTPEQAQAACKVVPGLLGSKEAEAFVPEIIGHGTYCEKDVGVPIFDNKPIETGKGHMCCTLPAYIGTKVVGGEPMSKEEFDYRKKSLLSSDFTAIIGLPEFQENTPGYHVQYENPDGAIYDSWSPKDVFENAYQKVDNGLSLWHATYFLFQGKKIQRKNREWYVRKNADDAFEVVTEGDPSRLGEPWLPSIGDMKAYDWMVVNEPLTGHGEYIEQGQQLMRFESIE